MPKMAMQMPALWKPRNGFHRALEISQRTRDSHIRTATTRFVEERRTEYQRTTTRSTTDSLGRRQLMAGFEVSINGRFSGVHRGLRISTNPIQHISPIERRSIAQPPLYTSAFEKSL